MSDVLGPIVGHTTDTTAKIWTNVRKLTYGLGGRAYDRGFFGGHQGNVG